MIQVEGLTKGFQSGTRRITVLREASLAVAKNEMVALTGPSGVGKSTLLHLLAGLDRPDAGSIRVGGFEVTSMQGAEKDSFRRRTVGIVYQFHFLLPEFTALENVLMPAVVSGERPGAAAPRALDLLKEVGLSERAHHVPGRLSGGEQQRVALARALMNGPGLLLADEPTGNLDEETADQVFDLLLNLRSRKGLTVLLATHNPRLAAACDRTLRLHEGRVLS
ncbi:MAG: ABC transporter ATP-binding protein [Acidobacteriota bacterium]